MNVKWISIVVVLVVGVGVAAGLGGYTVGVKAGQTQAASIRSDFLNQRGVGNPPGMPGGAQGGAGQGGGLQFSTANFATGQVKQVDGDIVQLSTAAEVLKIKIGAETLIQKTDSGTASDIQPGERITVQGTRGSDGSFAAQMIQIGGAPGGGMPGRAPGAPASN